MDPIVQHKNLEESWREKNLAFQLTNIGSEVSRSLKNRDKPARFQGAFNRALELFDLTIDCNIARGCSNGTLKELCRAREEFCDYFNGNSYHTDPVKMQRYYDQFISLI